MNFETELERIAEQYRSEGYEVVVRPQKSQLPPFAEGWNVELLAANGDRKVLVQVKRNQDDLKRDPDAPRMAEVTAAQPGWRYDLFVLGEGRPREQIAEGAVEPAPERILQSLDEVERACARAGQVAPSFLVGWASLEAAMRRAARAAGIPLKSDTTEFLLLALYSNGLVEREEFDALKDHLRTRNAILHGLEVPGIDTGAVLAVAGAARKLLAWDGKEQVA
jgi:hypothetical protein